LNHLVVEVMKMHVALDQTMLGRAPQRVWAEGLVNPLDWTVRTVLGPFTTSDRSTWHTPDHVWTIELRRSRNRRHVYLALFDEGTYLGRFRCGWLPEHEWPNRSGRSSTSSPERLQRRWDEPIVARRLHTNADPPVPRRTPHC
jgi:hypothetical protein